MKRSLLAGVLILRGSSLQADGLGECYTTVSDWYFVKAASVAFTVEDEYGFKPRFDAERLARFRNRSAECFSQYPQFATSLADSAADGASFFWRASIADGFKKTCWRASRD